MSNQIPNPTPEPQSPESAAQESLPSSSTRSASDTIELQEALAQMAAAVSVVNDLAKKLPLRGHPIALAELEEHDVYVVADVRVYTKNGMEYQIKHSNHIPYILSDSMLPEAHRNFETQIFGNLFRPILNRFMTLLQNRLGPLSNRAGQPLLVERTYEDANVPAAQGPDGYLTGEKLP